MANTNKRTVGKTKDVGFQVGARQTFAISLQKAWDLITSRDGLNIWLGKITDRALAQGLRFYLDDGCSGEIRIYSPLSHIRLTWQPKEWSHPSTIQVRVIPRGKKTAIAFHQEHLPGPDEREVRKVFFKHVLKQLESTITKNT